MIANQPARTSPTYANSGPVTGATAIQDFLLCTLIKGKYVSPVFPRHWTCYLPVAESLSERQ